MNYLDLSQAVQEGVFQALQPLAGEPSMPPGLGVFQHVPENTQPPMLIIGQMHSKDMSDGHDQIEEITFEVIGKFVGAGRAPLMDMMNAARALLHGETLAPTDWPNVYFTQAQWLKTEVSEAVADGVTYIAASSYQVIVQPNS